MTRVVVVGGADQGRQVIDAIEAAGEHTVVGVLDRGIPVGTLIMGHQVLGRDDELAKCAAITDAGGFIIAIGDNHTRGSLLERALSDCPHLDLVTVVHPTALIARDAVVGAGSIILAGAVVSNGCTVGRGVLLGTHASIDHDCVVDDHASFAPGATAGGTVRVGRATVLGLGSNVVHRISIGMNTVVGASALVLEDLPDNVVAYGVPARIARSRAPDEPYL